MTLADIDLEHNRCRVDGKTGVRQAVFSEGCRAALCNYLQHEQHPLRIKDPHTPADSRVWLTVDGQPLSFYGCESIIRRIRRDSGVYFHPHMLRHTFASTLAEHGVNAFDLKSLLGHKTVTTTQIYVHQNVQHLNDVHSPHSPLAALPGISQQITRRRGRPRKGRE